MDEAMGGTQAVQDFVIHIDMSLQTDDGPVSFYKEVLNRAKSGAGKPVDLAGGFTFSDVDSIGGTVVDADGERLPSISLSFGLLDVPFDHLREANEELAGILRSNGFEQAGDFVAQQKTGEAQLLVEVATADFSRSRTHVGPRDESAVDLTFVDAIAPGDSLAMRYLFGETLPGDPAEEYGLSGQELFAYRWNHGLIAIQGDEYGVSAFLDENVEAVSGSTIATRKIKEAILFGAFRKGSEEVFSDLAPQLEATPTNEKFEIELHDGTMSVERRGSAEDGYWVCIEPNPEAPSDFCVNDVEMDVLVPLWALDRGLSECVRVAGELNRRNESGGIPLSELGLASEDSEEAQDGTSSDGETSTTTEAEPPGPVSCVDPPPDLFPKTPSGGAWGDPHIRTIDGNFYDNMATGEFLAFDNSVATIQMRTEPWPGQDSVSLSTAFAFRVGEHAVSVHGGGATWIDDEPAELTRGKTIAVGDAELLRWEGGWVLVWPDGTVARVYLRTAALILVVTPSDRPSLGLLGDNDGDPDNDLVTRSGAQLEPDADDDFETFYPTYIDSWRITDEESLFHYEPGENTSSFVIEGFPAMSAVPSSLDPETRGGAEEVCASAGVSGDQLFESCVLDVGLTGDTSFAYDTFVVATSTTQELHRDESTADRSPSVDGGSILSIGNLAVEFGPEPPVKDPNGPSAKWQCDVTDGSFHATSTFDESPTRKYELTIEYLDAIASGTGQERFTLIVKMNAVDYVWVLNWVEHFSDAVDTISLEGGTLRATGSAFMNQELSPAVSPFSALPQGASLQPFALETTCDR